MVVIPEHVKNHLRVAVAMCALAHKPAAQSLHSYLIDLRARYPCRNCAEGTAATEQEWRDRAISLEDDIKRLEGESAKYRAELDFLRARESIAGSQASSKRPSGESPRATPRKRRKKATSVEEKPTSKPPTVDWSRVTEPLGLELRHPGIQNSLDVLSSVRNLVALRETIRSKDTAETIPSERLFAHTDRCLSSIARLLSLALSPSSTDTQRKQASDGLSMLLPSVLTVSLSMTAYASSKASSSPGDTSGITKTLAGSFFDPIIRSFIPVSRSIFLFVPPRTVSGSISSKPSTTIKESERGIGSKLPRHDIRPSLLATIQRTLDSLRFIRPDLAPPLCLLTSLSVIPELRKLWFASTVGVCYQEVGLTQRRTNRNRTRDEKEAFEKQKMRDLADHDAAWYLLSILNSCFEPDVLPISTASSRLIALLKMRLTHELTELARVLCFTDRAQRTTTAREGSGPSLVEEGMVLDVYEKAWLNGWLDGPAYPETEDLTIGPLERPADMGGKEKGIGESMGVQEQTVNTE